MANIDPSTAEHNASLMSVLDSLLVDITNVRAEVVKLVADVATIRTATNAIRTKLNSDGGVSDTDYAAITTLTAAAPTALTTTS